MPVEFLGVETCAFLCSPLLHRCQGLLCLDLRPPALDSGAMAEDASRPQRISPWYPCVVNTHFPVHKEDITNFQKGSVIEDQESTRSASSKIILRLYEISLLNKIWTFEEKILDMLVVFFFSFLSFLFANHGFLVLRGEEKKSSKDRLNRLPGHQIVCTKQHSDDLHVNKSETYELNVSLEIHMGWKIERRAEKMCFGFCWAHDIWKIVWDVEQTQSIPLLTHS